MKNKGRCRHFTGIMNKKCEAEVNYRSVRDNAKSPYQWPCIPEPDTLTKCNKYDPFTPEELKEREDRIMRSFYNINTARAAIVEATQDAWGVAGELLCPVCESGTLKYIRSACNGHIMAACSTDGCVQWIE